MSNLPPADENDPIFLKIAERIARNPAIKFGPDTEDDAPLSKGCIKTLHWLATEYPNHVVTIAHVIDAAWTLGYLTAVVDPNRDELWPLAMMHLSDK